MSRRLEHVYFGTTEEGYERWVDPIAKRTVGVHQLVAISEGADPSKIFSNGEWQVHHKNKIGWFNIPSNLEVLKSAEHMSIHATERVDGNMDRPWCDKDLMEDMYWEKGYSREELAEEWDASKSTIRMWLKKHGLRWDQYNK